MSIERAKITQSGSARAGETAEVDSKVMLRRAFLKSAGVASAALSTTPLLISKGNAFEGGFGPQRPTRGDIDILRFLATAELIEADLWQQYAELGGVTSGSRITTSSPCRTSIPTALSTSPAIRSTR